jgi:formylglycine-generating enzyme required for sulfatase activity
MPNKVFIRYRRDDAAGHAGRLNRLKSVARRRWVWIAAAIAAVLIAYVGNYYKDMAEAELREAKLRADEAAKAESYRRQAEAAAQRDPASIKPGSGESFIDRLADGQPCPQCPEMVIVPAGKFTMGSPPTEEGHSDRETQVPVTIARPFAVGKFAVTFDQWDACVADGGCTYRPGDEGWGRGNRPVINVNWDDANAYAEWLSRKTGKAYRLLSEAEREYVTRADTTTPYWWGSSVTPEQANFFGPHHYKGTVPVDTFEPNPWGLYNVHGNVGEWTADCWNDSNEGNPGDGSARTTGDCTRHVNRGGEYSVNRQGIRAAARIGITEGRSNLWIRITHGFRVARTLNP